MNRCRPHVYLIPEDQENRNLATGFLLYHLTSKQIKIMPNAGGWLKVIETIKDEYFGILRRNVDAHVVGLIDCDNQPERIRNFTARWPEDIRNRIFLFGVIPEAEDFRRAYDQHLEILGGRLANECYENRLELWQSDLFEPAREEIDRAKTMLKTIVFNQP